MCNVTSNITITAQAALFNDDCLLLIPGAPHLLLPFDPNHHWSLKLYTTLLHTAPKVVDLLLFYLCCFILDHWALVIIMYCLLVNGPFHWPPLPSLRRGRDYSLSTHALALYHPTDPAALTFEGGVVTVYTTLHYFYSGEGFLNLSIHGLRRPHLGEEELNFLLRSPLPSPWEEE